MNNQEELKDSPKKYPADDIQSDICSETCDTNINNDNSSEDEMTLETAYMALRDDRDNWKSKYMYTLADFDTYKRNEIGRAHV